METTKEERKRWAAIVNWRTMPPSKLRGLGMANIIGRLIRDVDTLEGLLVRAALGEEPQIRAYHEPLCGECLGCQVRAVLAPPGE